MQEQFEAASARPFDDVFTQSFTTNFSDVTLADQRTAMAEMKSGNTSASSYLPAFEIDGADSGNAKAALHAGSRDGGAVSTARDYWESYKEDSAKEGGISGFAKFVVGNTMGYIVEGVQAAVDARSYWAEAEKNATNPVSAVLSAGMHDILVPFGALDHMGTAINEVTSVNFNQVENGLRQGVLKGTYNRAADVVGTVQWLDQQIPPDGTEKTMDRRTALLVALASAEAQKLTSDPIQQEQIAYDRLFALRNNLVAFEKDLPNNFKGRELDQDMAAAEHYFEVSMRVASEKVEMALPGVGSTEVSNNGYLTAPAWAAIGAGYALAKRTGILGGSEAGEFQSSWELAGIIRGLEINKR